MAVGNNAVAQCMARTTSASRIKSRMSRAHVASRLNMRDCCCRVCCTAGKPMYSVGLMPSNTYALEMSANSTGSWDYYCNVLDHITAGMKARMVVS